MRNISRNVMNSERDAIAVGGRSMVALLIPHTSGNVNEEHTNFAMEQFQIFREEVPDLRFVFWTGGPFNRFERFVREPARDLFPLNINLQGVGGDSIQSISSHKFTQIDENFHSLFFLTSCCFSCYSPYSTRAPKNNKSQVNYFPFCSQ